MYVQLVCFVFKAKLQELIVTLYIRCNNQFALILHLRGKNDPCKLKSKESVISVKVYNHL